MRAEIEAAKQELDIPTVWLARGWRGEPGARCRIPFRDDQKPSGSIFCEGRLFHDFSTGRTLDVIGLLAAVEEVDVCEATRRFMSFARSKGVSHEERRSSKGRQVERLEPSTAKNDRKRLVIPDLRRPTTAELRVIAGSRGVGVMACEVAAQLGCLFTTDRYGQSVWALTDQRRMNCQYRRIDGEPFRFKGSASKTISEKGSWAGWPIGAGCLEERTGVPGVALVEGTTDFLAALHFILREEREEDVQPVCCTGASNQIPEEVIELLRGRVVRIFPDVDLAGARAAYAWELQLRRAGIEVDCFDLGGLAMGDGRPVNDLNDVVGMADHDIEAIGPMMKY